MNYNIMETGLVTLMLVTCINVQARIPAPKMFKASMCYDIYGSANVQLRCPDGFDIMTRTAFTGISRTNACSYQAWDCVVQEGTMQRCDGKFMCTISVTYSESKETWLSCGDIGKIAFFQIEYDCIAGDGKSATVMEVSSTTAPPISMTTNHMGNQSEGTSQVDQKKESLAEDKYTLIAIICGTVAALILVVVVTATLAHRIKNRTYEHSSLYGPMAGGLINPTLTPESREFALKAAQDQERNGQIYNTCVSRHAPFDTHSTVFSDGHV